MPSGSTLFQNYVINSVLLSRPANEDTHVAGVAHCFRSTMSRAECIMNWLRCADSSPAALPLEPAPPLLLLLLTPLPRSASYRGSLRPTIMNTDINCRDLNEVFVFMSSLARIVFPSRSRVLLTHLPHSRLCWGYSLDRALDRIAVNCKSRPMDNDKQ